MATRLERCGARMGGRVIQFQTERETERREAAEPGTPRGFLKRTIVKTMTNVKSRPVTSHLGSQSPETALATPVRAVRVE